MMRAKLLALAEQRTRLAARAQTEREALVALLGPAEAFNEVLSLLRGGLAQAARYPLVVGIAAALIVVLNPRRALRWFTRGWSLWRLYRGAQGLWQRFSAVSETARPRQAL